MPMENYQEFIMGLSSTALDLVSADVASQPDVSQPSVNGFRRGKVHNLGGRVTN